MIHCCELIGTNEGKERRLHLQGPVSCRHCNARKMFGPLMYGVISQSSHRRWCFLPAMLLFSCKISMEKEEDVEESSLLSS